MKNIDQEIIQKRRKLAYVNIGPISIREGNLKRDEVALPVWYNLPQSLKEGERRRKEISHVEDAGFHQEFMTSSRSVILSITVAASHPKGSL